jgi:hypothetical protein
MATTLGDNRELALLVGYVSIEWPQFVPYKQYKSNFEDWTVRSVERDGECIGAVYTKDGELHVAILPPFHKRWVTRRVLRELFDMPKVIVKPLERDDPMFGYLLRLGFKDVGDKTLIKER